MTYRKCGSLLPLLIVQLSTPYLLERGKDDDSGVSVDSLLCQSIRMWSRGLLPVCSW